MTADKTDSVNPLGWCEVCDDWAYTQPCHGDKAADNAHSVDPPAATYMDRLSLVIKLLYGAHKRIVFDTAEDTELQEKVLARVRELLGFDPEVCE